ncbi:MAG: hypothetical protein HQL80_00545 [Magnetococcales bacterium]|nr:hypothetical protein [Magnetococcales bacterium]
MLIGLECFSSQQTFFDRNMVRCLATLARIKGDECVVINFRDPDVFRTLELLRSRDDSVVYWGMSFSVKANFDVFVDREESINLPLFLGRPSIGMIADHPFYLHKKPRIFDLPMSMYLFGKEYGYGHGLAMLRPGYSRYASFPVNPWWPMGFESLGTVCSYGEKDIDLLVQHGGAGRRVYDFQQKIDEFIRKTPLIKDLAYSYMDLAVDTYDVYPTVLFSHLFRRLYGYDINKIMDSSPRDFYKIIFFLSHLDLFVRGRRRVRFLESLKLESFPGKVVILSDDDVTKMPEGPNITIMPPTKNYREYLSLIGRSRMTAYSDPTYPRSVGERVEFALRHGCAVFCERNGALNYLSNNGFAQDQGMFLRDDISLDASFRLTQRNGAERTVAGVDFINRFPSMHSVIYRKMEEIVGEKVLSDGQDVFRTSYSGITVGVPPERDPYAALEVD